MSSFGSRGTARRHIHTKHRKPTRKAKKEKERYTEDDYDFKSTHSLSLTPKRKVADIRLRALSLNFELFVRERELTFFVNEFLKMRCFQHWRRLLGRVLLNRVSSLKQRHSTTQSPEPTHKSEISHYRNGHSPSTRPLNIDASASLMFDLSDEDDTRPHNVIVSKPRPEMIEQVKLDLSDEFVIAAINRRFDTPTSSIRLPPEPSEFVMSDSDEQSVSIIPKAASPIRSMQIPGRLSPRQIVEEEFESVSEAKPSVMAMDLCPTLPDDLFSSNVFQCGRKDEDTTSAGEKQREVGILKRVLRKMSPKLRQTRSITLSEDYNESAVEDPKVNRDLRRKREELSDISTDFSLSSTVELKADLTRAQAKRRDISSSDEGSLDIDDGFRITESGQRESPESSSASAAEEESIDSSAAIEFLLREPAPGSRF